MEDLAALVAAEIEALHAAFERWFRGEAKDTTRIEAALAPGFTFVSPQGDVVPRAQLVENLRDARGRRPDLRIRIEHATLRWHGERTALATYEEWHEHPTYTTARQSSALFHLDEGAPDGLSWIHVHETWKQPPPHRR